jgi:hypothetical protein
MTTHLQSQRIDYERCLRTFKFGSCNKIGGPRKDVARQMGNFFPRCGAIVAPARLTARPAVFLCRQSSSNLSLPISLKILSTIFLASCVGTQSRRSGATRFADTFCDTKGLASVASRPWRS